ncbi:MAG: hypothetical protein H7319_21975 [Spirosoma sp.]|nr:hypothetical protein [Spirosoma sp.]
MDVNILKTVGQVAGIGGIAIGMIILVFRDVIRRNIFPNLERNQAYNLLRIILFLTWSIGVLGILAYVYIQPRPTTIIEQSIGERIPGGSGWILVGEYDENINKFVRGPFYRVTNTNYPSDSIFPRKGESIILTKGRQVVISDYKISGVAKWNAPPWQENVLDSNDYTGTILPKGTELEVRDVSMGHFEGMPFVVWVRIAPIPQ